MKKTLLALTAMALLAGPAPARAQAKNYGPIKQQIELFETLLNIAIKQRFEGKNVLMLQAAKGTYLEGYGAVFTLEVNLATLRYASPFSGPPSEKEIKDARAVKTARLKETEELLRGLIRDHGAGLNFLRPEENLAVVVHLFNVSEHRDLPVQMIVQGKRAAFDKLSVVAF